MPSKYVLRDFEEGAYYHVFNRGVEKRRIFLGIQDCKIFLYYLYIYSQPLEQVLKRYPDLPIRLWNKNLSVEIDLIAYCLMPNHFHILLRQNTKNGVSKFMKQVTNAFTEYFNKKYKRTGSLMQGPFKAVRVKNDEQLIHLSRYIHLNPVVSGISNHLPEHIWSSYHEYVEIKKDGLCKKSLVLGLMRNVSYEDFVKDQIDYAKKIKQLEGLTIDN